MESLRQRLLDFYGIGEEECARLTREPSFSDIPTLEGSLAAKTMKERILKAVARDEKVIIYGDYDTDGIMATSILYYCFHKLGKNVQFYIPTRYTDGYALTMKNAENIARAGYSLVILVDNGIACVEPVSYLLSKGIETLIIDHHSVPAALPPAVAIVHPELLHYGTCPVSAGYMSYLFSIELLEKNDPYLMMLGALSTISDMMPMKDHNRTLVALAIRYIGTAKPKEIYLLAGVTRIDETVLSMAVIPAINSAGRLLEDTKLGRVVHYFADEKCDKEKLATWLLGLNEQRKSITNEAAKILSPDTSHSAIVVVGRLKEGLNGLLANRILTQYGKACAVLSPSSTEPDCYVGSMRVLGGMNLMDFLEENKTIVHKGGGHPHAGGVTIRKEDYPAFKKAFEKYAFDHPAIPDEKTPIPLLLEEINMDSFRLIRSFGPFGKEYPEPEFLLRDVPYSSLSFYHNDQMSRIFLPNGAKFISFSYGKNALDASKGFVPFRGKMRLNEYRGKIDLVFNGEKAS